MEIDFTKGVRFLISSEQQARKLLSVLINKQRYNFYDEITEVEYELLDFLYSGISFIDVKHTPLPSGFSTSNQYFGVIKVGKTKSDMPEGITLLAGTNAFIEANIEYVDGAYNYVELAALSSGLVDRTPNTPDTAVADVNRHVHADLIEWYIMDDRNEVETWMDFSGEDHWYIDENPRFDPDRRYRKLVVTPEPPKPRHNHLAILAMARDITTKLEYRSVRQGRVIWEPFNYGVPYTFHNSTDIRVVNSELDARVAKVVADEMLAARLADHFKTV